MKLKTKILYPAGALLVLVIALALYRLAGRLLEPENLLHASQALWDCCLLVLAAAMFMAGVVPKNIPVRRVNSVELMFLSGVAGLGLTGFLLAAWARMLAGSEPVQLFPFHLADSMPGQALLAGGLFTLCLLLLHLLLRRVAPERNPALLPVAFMLAGIGLVLLFRLSPDIAALRHRPAYLLLFWKQLRNLLVSLGIFTAALLYFSPERVNSLTGKKYIYGAASILCIVITALFGVELHGRRLALNLGIMNFQTVELVKLLALFFMVGYFRFEGQFLEKGKGRFGLPRSRYLLPYLFMWVLVLLPIFFQRDLGPTMLIFSLFLVIFYLGTGSALSVISGAAALGLAGTAAYYAGMPSMVRTRVNMWLDPFHYSQNISESLWAAASGGLFGKGTGMGLAHRIPVVQSDFNFSVLAEEWGFIGVIGLFILFAALVGSCLRIAAHREQPYQQLLAAGLGSLWLLQTVVIIGGNMALLPLTGITLPFISYGGSSLLMNWVMLALILRLSCGESGSRRDRTTVIG